MKKISASVMKLTLAAIILALTAFILWPQHIHREREYRPKCAANLKAIGAALTQYANSNGGRFPDSLAALLGLPDVDSSFFICPATKDTPASGATTQQATEAFSKAGHMSYVYAGAEQTLVASAAAVLAYEPLGNHGFGVNVLYGDGRVEMVYSPNAQSFIAELEAGHNPPRVEMLNR